MSEATDPKIIVAEVSKNWFSGERLGTAPQVQELLSQRFEHVVSVNLARGYRLHSWKMDRLFLPPNSINETIVAVFERIEG